MNEKLKLDFKLVVFWFRYNRMLLNLGKRNYMYLSSKTEKAGFDRKIFGEEKKQQRTAKKKLF